MAQYGVGRMRLGVAMTTPGGGLQREVVLDGRKGSRLCCWYTCRDMLRESPCVWLVVAGGG